MSDTIFGVVALLLAAGLAAGNGYIARQVLIGQSEAAARHPGLKALDRFNREQHPKLASSRFRLAFTRLWLLGITLGFGWIGISLLV